MKTAGEIITAFYNDEKLHHEQWRKEVYVQLVDGCFVDNNGEELIPSFRDPERWHIWQEPVKEWEPKYQPIYTGINTLHRKDKETAIRDAKAWESAIKLESFVREFAPDFVPVWGERYKFLIHLDGGWHFLLGEHNQHGRVPFPNNEGLEQKACDMLTAGTLKL